MSDTDRLAALARTLDDTHSALDGVIAVSSPDAAVARAAAVREYEGLDCRVSVSVRRVSAAPDSLIPVS